MEKIFEYNEQIIMIETEEQLHELTAKMKKLEKLDYLKLEQLLMI